MTKKNEILTKEQEYQLVEFREGWRKYILSCERVDKETTKICISELYKLIDKKPPDFIFCPSLLSAQYQIISYKSVLGHNLWDDLGDLFINLIDNIWDNLRYNIGGDIITNLWDNLVVNLVGKIKPQYVNTSLYGSMDVYWVAFYEFPEKFLGVKYSERDKYILSLWSSLAKSCSWFWCYENYCFVSDRPEKLSFNRQNRIHCEDGPAIKWTDGWELYYWNDVEVPKEWILNKESINK